MEVESQTCPQLAIVFVVNIQPEGCFKASGKISTDDTMAGLVGGRALTDKSCGEKREER